jgi:DNA-binding HxlR family transcriptional regulator
VLAKKGTREMNANELAEELHDLDVQASQQSLNDWAEQAATMLRQQQAEIAELKHMNRNWQISENILLLELEKLQHRELTDREIYQTWVEAKNTALNTRGSDFVEVIFARAILRKAREK